MRTEPTENAEVPKETEPKSRPSRAEQARIRRQQKTYRTSMMGLTLTLCFAVIFVFLIALAQTGRPVSLPADVQNRIETRISNQLGSDRLTFGDMQVALGRDFAPRVQVSDVVIAEPGGGVAATFNKIFARLQPQQLVQGNVEVTDLVVRGAQVTLRRSRGGSFGPAESAGVSVPGFLEDLEKALNTGALRSLSTVEGQEFVLTLEDARSGRIWQATNATVVARKSAENLRLGVTTDIFNGSDDVAQVQMSLDLDRSARTTTLGATVTDMPATDIAQQAPALAWLALLDSPISGSVRTQLDAEGSVTRLDGTLDFGAGAIQPTPDTPPLAFETAKTYFSFDPTLQRMEFSDISVMSPTVQLNATGHADLSEVSDGWPGAFVGQFTVSDMSFARQDMFADAIALTDVSLDTRLRLDPFSFEVGQLVSSLDGETLRATGQVTAGAEGWDMAVNAAIPRITPERVVDHWPLTVAPGTRRWLSGNILAGEMKDVSTALRVRTGQKPDISLSFEFEDSDVQFLGTMPPVAEASGRAGIAQDAFTIVVDQGHLTSPNGQRLDGAGTVFHVGDIREKPARADVRIAADGPIEGVLQVLDQPPLSLMRRVGRETNLADGNAAVRAHLRLPLKKGIVGDDVAYDVTAQLSRVSSQSLVPGRVLEARELELRATRDAVEISGPASLSDVPISARWRQPLGQGAGRVSGEVALTPQTLAAFGIELPRGMLGGSATGRYEIDLNADRPPELTLTSDLAGLSLSVPALGWAKGRQALGDFKLVASLGDAPEVKSLELSSAGLSLDGRVDLAEGQVTNMSFNQLRVGRWLDAGVRLTPRGGSRAPAIVLDGGTFDLRRFEPSGSGGGGQGTPISVALDRLIVTDKIVLTGVRGQLEPVGGGLSGQLTARVNGKTPVAATLAPRQGGTAIRVRSDDAGGAVRDAGFTPNARGGSLDLTLVPVAGAANGTYDGQFVVEDVSLRKAPAVADLLDAISVVGLLDQLDGPGIRFDTVDGQFRLTPRRVTVQRAAAVGASMGISAEGIFDLASKQMDVQGVVSPVYFVNSIGSIFSRRGEGLFGFNYRMSGPMDTPKVGVNPLSILTPGMFREIFRRPPPEG